MKLNAKTSKLYNLAAVLAVLGLLTLPVGCTHLDQVGSSHENTTEDEYKGEKVDWTLAEAETEEDETDWTLAKTEESSEEEVDWTLAEAETEEDETDWTLA